MAGLRGRLDRIEEEARLGAAERLWSDLARASDEDIARGMTEESVERAVGASPEDLDPETLQRRLDWIFFDLLTEPRRTRIRAALARLGA